MDNGIKNYLTVDTLGKSKLEFVIRVYDGVIGCLKNAVDYYRKEDWQAGYDAMEKAKKFLVHLYTTLDEEKGGDIAGELGQVYAFIIQQINFVQATKNLSRIEVSMTALENIREAWVELDRQQKNKTKDGDTATNPHLEKPCKRVSYSA